MRQLAAWMLRDLRSVRWLAIAVGAITLAVSLTAHADPDVLPRGAPDLLFTVMLLGWWGLVERIMHNDPVPGDREAWYTLPVSRSLLTISKLTLIVALIFIPRILGELALSAFEGADMGAILLSMPLRVMTHFTIAVLPAIVLSVLTRNMSQYFVAVIAAVLLFLSIETLFRPTMNRTESGEAWWITQWLLLLTGLTIGTAGAFWLYHTRHVLAGRSLALSLIAAAPLVIPALPTAYQWVWHHRWQGNPELERQIAFSLDETDLLLPEEPDAGSGRRRQKVNGIGGLPVPLKVAGVSEDIAIWFSGGEYTIRTPGGGVYARGPIRSSTRDSARTKPVIFLRPRLPQLALASLPDTVSLELAVHFEVFRREEHVAPLQIGQNYLKGVGHCWRSYTHEIDSCTSLGPRFPYVIFESPRIQDPHRWNSLGSPDFEAELISLPVWSATEKEGFSFDVGAIQVRYWIWRYLAPVETKIVIPNYRVSEYTYPSYSN